MSEQTDLIRQAFDARAAEYDESTMHRLLATAVADYLDLDGVRTVLDIATGTGLVLRALALSGRASGIRCIGADISPAMLQVAERALPTAEWVVADATRLPLADASGDIATCVTALHIIPDVPAALDEWRRVLRPGGRLVTASFSTPHPSSVTAPTAARPYPQDHAPYASVEAITASFAPRGFHLERHEQWRDGTDTVLIAEFAAAPSS